MPERKKTEDPQPETIEIESLNVEDLDTEELEHRVELAAAVPSRGCWGFECDCNGVEPKF